jgi:hypothetical protein
VSPFRPSLQQQLGSYSRPFNSCHPARIHNSRCFILLQTLCRRQKTQPLCNQANPNSFLQNTRGRGTSARSQRSLRLTLSPRRVHPACPSFEASREGRVIISLCFCRHSATLLGERTHPFSRRSLCALSTFRINTSKSVSKQMTLTPFRMNTCQKPGGGGVCKCQRHQRIR